MTSDRDLIDAAITKLNRLVTTCSPGPWVRGGIGNYGWTVYTEADDNTGDLLSMETSDSEIGKVDAELIATLNPITVNALIGLLTGIRDTSGDLGAAAVLAQAILHHGREDQ